MFPIAKSRQDVYLKHFLNLNGFFSVLAVVLIFYFLGKESLLALTGQASSFFLDESWFPSEGKFNLVPMLVGSTVVTLGAVLLAFPLGLFSAIFIQFYAARKLAWVFRRAVELYSGIPSVIFGFWGLMKVVPLINSFHPPGQSLLAGILVLGLMIFPIITLNLISSIEQAGEKYFRLSESMGLRKSLYIWKILIPSLRKSILGGTLLAIGRAVGETMAVLMVCGNIVKVPSTIFEPIRTLTANIALEMSYAMDSHRSSLFVSGLILLLVVAFLFSLADLIEGDD